MSHTAAPGPSGASGGAETHHPGVPAWRAESAEAPVNPDAEALVAAHSQARQQAESGNLTGARTLLEDALAIGEVRLGHTHPRLAPLMVDLATIARNLGNLTEASTQLRRAYAIIVSASGPENPTALSVEGRLAAVTYRLGEPTEAYDWHLANVGTRVLGEEHPAVRGALERLAARPSQPEPVQHHYVPSPDSPGVYNLVPPELHPRPSPDNLPPGPVSYAPEHMPEEAVNDVHRAAAVYPAARPEPAPYVPSVNTYPVSPHHDPPHHDPSRQDQPNPYDEPSGIYARDDEYEDEDGEDDVWQEPRVRRTGRGHGAGIAVVVALGAAILIGAVVLAAQLFGPTPHVGAPSLPTVTAIGPTPPPAPTDIKIQDNGGSVVLTWSDPSNGSIPFIVAGGRDGSTSGPLETVPPGRPTSTIYGLNINYEYCFTVTAIWSSEIVAPSNRTCTSRSPTSRAP